MSRLHNVATVFFVAFFAVLFLFNTPMAHASTIDEGGNGKGDYAGNVCNSSSGNDYGGESYDIDNLNVSPDGDGIDISNTSYNQYLDVVVDIEDCNCDSSSVSTCSDNCSYEQSQEIFLGPTETQTIYPGTDSGNSNGGQQENAFLEPTQTQAVYTGYAPAQQPKIILAASQNQSGDSGKTDQCGSAQTNFYLNSVNGESQEDASLGYSFTGYCNDCDSNAPQCSPNASLQCSGNSLYYFDSCGNQDSLYQTCGSNQTCSNGQCQNNTSGGGSGCTGNSSCGTSGPTGYSFCGSSTAVYQSYISYTCNSGTCGSSASNQLLQNCGSGQVCYDSGAGASCITPSCSSNSQCGQNSNTGSPYCYGSYIFQNSINWYCNNPNTNYASCYNTTNANYVQYCALGCDSSTGAAGCVPCNTASDCGISGFTGATSCNGNAIYQNYQQYDCSNAGHSTASCSSSNTSMLELTCPSGQACSSAGGTQPHCAAVACSRNSDCGQNGPVGSAFCSSNTVSQNYTSYTCNNPGTASASCSSATTRQALQTCPSGQTCSSGICTSNNTCGLTGIGGAIPPNYVTGFNIVPVSNTVTGSNNTNTATFNITNTSSSLECLNVTTDQYRCTQALGYPYGSGGTGGIAGNGNGQCQYYYDPTQNPNDQGGQSQTQTICISPGSTYVVTDSVNQYQNQACGSSQLDVGVSGLGGYPPFTLIGSSFTDMCQDCPAPSIACSSAANCPSTSTASPYCCSSGGKTVCQNTTAYTCTNPGTVQSACTPTTTSQTTQTCSSGQICSGSGVCSSVACSATSPCASTTGTPYCCNSSGLGSLLGKNTVCQNTTAYTCTNPGQVTSQCANPVVTTTTTTCPTGQTCSGSGVCSCSPNGTTTQTCNANNTGVISTDSCGNQTTTNCPSGQVCSGGKCACTPNVSQTCVGGVVTLIDSCGNQTAGTNCSTTGKVCVASGSNASCQACTLNSQCGSGQSCIGGSCSCTPGQNITKTCNTGNTAVISTDSCGNQTTANCTTGQTCSNGTCACTQNVSEQCVGNTLYWFNSCGGQGSIVQNCSLTNQLCSGVSNSCVNNPPTATNLSVADSSYCTGIQGDGLEYFSWTYGDVNASPESQFQFEITTTNDPNFFAPVVNRTFSNLSNPSGTINQQSVLVGLAAAPDAIVYNTPYIWRVIVYDSSSPALNSGWVQASGTYTKTGHPAPSPSFTYSPASPTTGKAVTFTNTSICYNNAGQSGIQYCSSFTWNLGDTSCSPQTSCTTTSLTNPSHVYSAAGTYNVTLNAYDNTGAFCQVANANLAVSPATPGTPSGLPSWKEVSPF